jgi:hypothetical protein
MYGAFSIEELKTLCLWIDHLTPLCDDDIRRIVQNSYLGFTNRTINDLSNLDHAQRDILVDYPVIETAMRPVLMKWLTKQSGDYDLLNADVVITGKLSLGKLLPLWFTNTALLEGLMTVPVRTCTEEVSALVRVVRR